MLEMKVWIICHMKTWLWSIWSVNSFYLVCLYWWQICEIQQFFLFFFPVVVHCRPLSGAPEWSKRRWLLFPGVWRLRVILHACVHVEAGVVAGQWRPLRLRLHRCPLVNDRAEGSCSSVYAVIKHSKPTGWQPAHFLAPGLSVEKETCLMLCFPAQWNPTRVERYKRKRVGVWVQITMCCYRFSKKLFHLFFF